MTTTFLPHDVSQPIAASMSSGAVPHQTKVSYPGAPNQSLLSLMSAGLLSMQATEGAQPSLLPPSRGGPALPSAPPVLGTAVLTNSFSGD